MKEPKKEEFLAMSFQYLVENGIDNISLRELCKTTGISMGSVYYWFGGKDELLVEAVQFGLMKVCDSIFDYAYSSMSDLKNFFETCLKEVSKFSKELRLIYQLATSPQYGEYVRNGATDVSFVYERYIKSLSGIIGCDMEKLKPIVYIVLATVLDYVIWDDYEMSKGQMDYIYNTLITTL